MENSPSLFPPFFGRFRLILSSLNIIYMNMESIARICMQFVRHHAVLVKISRSPDFLEVA